MTVPEALTTQLKAMSDKAIRSLRAAKRHLDEGDDDFACSKAYYAIFHLMQAALLTKGKSYSKHSGVISGFSECFIKTKVFPANFGEIIQNLRKDRELGDYGYQLSVTPDDASEDIKKAEEMAEAIQRYPGPYLKK